VALASFGYAAVATFIVLHLESRGVGSGATVFAGFAAMIVLTRPVFGDLPDRMGAAPVAIAATVGEACGLLLIAVAHSLPVALAGGIVMGAAFALLNPSLMLIALGHVSQQARGAAMGTYTAFFDAGVGLGAPIAGIVAALTSYEGAFVFAAAVCLASAMMTFVHLHPGRTSPPKPLRAPSVKFLKTHFVGGNRFMDFEVENRSKVPISFVGGAAPHRRAQLGWRSSRAPRSTLEIEGDSCRSKTIRAGCRKCDAAVRAATSLRDSARKSSGKFGR
jgi:MFS family permease